jgi:ubiquilin
MATISVNVRLSDASTFTVSVSPEGTVKDLKTAIDPQVPGGGCPPEQQKLVYKGRILKDEDSLASYGERSASG